MMEHAIYSVISPEGAASILWRDSAKARDAATNMKITAQDLLQLGVIDGIIPEPVGGAHRDPDAAIKNVSDAIELALIDFENLDGVGHSQTAPGKVPDHRKISFLRSLAASLVTLLVAFWPQKIWKLRILGTRIRSINLRMRPLRFTLGLQRDFNAKSRSSPCKRARGKIDESCVAFCAGGADLLA